jgi:UDP-N-acetylmuramyl pentapeptide phosphotransferase/UDP-N-acetylglucosamine-1-phosphate transferase
MNSLFTFICPLVISSLVTAYLIPCWISVCNKWNLFEKTDERKKHRDNIPTLGGLAIYAGIMITFLILGQDLAAHTIKYLMAASLILFFTGFFDDLLDLPASKKLIFQLVAAFLISFGGTRITNLYGMLGIHELPVMFQYIVTMVFIVAITNAYNLVDGIDGLAGSLGLVANMIFGTIFIMNGFTDFAILSFCISGALLGFLLYNFHPAKIFMGDTGSLIIGFLIASQSINVLTMSNAIPGIQQISPAIVMAVIFVPVYDVIRVSVIRILTGYSPFKPDRNHVHHMISEQGFGQRVTTMIIVCLNVLFVTMAIVFSSLNINLFVILSFCLGMIMINTLMMARLATLWGKLGGKLYDRKRLAA